MMSITADSSVTQFTRRVVLSLINNFRTSLVAAFLFLNITDRASAAQQCHDSKDCCNVEYACAIKT